ncbi:unnamed protein product [Cuscuta campestris]|uniref:Uncharacterized protein n=1 Tax=Cuscuta campestris TaxID=132261 RepID=A0A484KX92_9ASTE|nr:unnamed protein product [Cuscuta campestris]
MTKVVAVVVVVIFFTLSPSLARIQISKPKYEAVVRQHSGAMPEYDDVKDTLRLPSEASNEEETFEFDGLVEQPDKTDQPIENRAVHRPRPNNELGKKPNDQNIDFEGENAHPKSNDYNEVKARLVDLKRNSLFRLRSGVPYRLCRHNHLHHIEETIPDGPQLEFPFGDDATMLSLPVENAGFEDRAVFHDDSVSHGRSKRFPFQYDLHDSNNENEAPNRLSKNSHNSFREVEPRWEKFLHRYYHDQHRGPRHLRHHKGMVWTRFAGKEKVNSGREVAFHNNEGGSMRKRIRKFLGQYFG